MGSVWRACVARMCTGAIALGDFMGDTQSLLNDFDDETAAWTGRVSLDQSGMAQVSYLSAFRWLGTEPWEASGHAEHVDLWSVTFEAGVTEGSQTVHFDGSAWVAVGQTTRRPWILVSDPTPVNVVSNTVTIVTNRACACELTG